MNERQIKLARLLIEHDTFFPASFYSKKLSVSTKTVYQDLEALKLFLKPYSIQIKKLPSVGIQLVGNHGEKKAFLDELEDQLSVDQYAPNNRRIRIIKDIFLEAKESTLEKLSDEFLVSKTSLYNDLKLIHKIIEVDRVTVDSDADGIRVGGDENSIQKALKRLIFYFAGVLPNKSLKNNLEVFFSKKLIDQIYSIVLEDFSEITEGVSEHYLQSLLTTLLIQCRRLQLGYHANAESDYLFNSIRYMETYIVANEVVDRLSESLQLNFDDNDKEHLSRQLFAHRITNEIKVENKEYIDIVHRLIERMSNIEKVDLTQNRHLFNSLLYHIPAMILRLKKGIRIENPLLDNIKNQYSELFSIVWYALVILEEEYDVILNDDEISLILIHFQIALDNQSKANNILIICQYGISSAQFIYMKVRRFLPAHDNVETSTLDKFKKSGSADVDLIISSIDIPDSQVPYVKVTPLVNSDDYIRIMEAYTKYLIRGGSFGSNPLIEAKMDTSTLSKYIEPQLIRLNVGAKDKEECLNLMIFELERRKYINSNFRKSVFDREKIGDTNLESGVALPHADPNTIMKSHVFFLTLKKPINWGDRNVKVVIMVNLCEKDISEIRSVVEELYQFIDDEKKVDTIIKIKDQQCFLRLFCNEGE